MSETPVTTEERIVLVAKGNLGSEDASQFMNEMFDSPNYLPTLLGYSAPQQFIDGLYGILCSAPLDPQTHKRCFQALRKTGAETGLLPTSYHVTFPLKRQDVLPNAAGGFSDVWKADDQAGATFALKILRVTQQDDFLEIKKRFCKEVLVAKRVKHDNVLAIVGVQMSDEPEFKLCIVSEWMERGNMHTYLRNNEVVDRIELLLGVTKGLNYLHSIEVVHGDLKSSNVLIDPEGNPRLMDFGFSSITRDDSSVNCSTPSDRGSTRWRAPELLALSTKAKNQKKVKSARPTTKSDTYSFAMVVVEIFTGRHPFDSHSDEQVILLLAKDLRPDRPEHEQFTSEMWSLTKKCWKKDPTKRPEISAILNKLESGNGRNRLRLLPPSLGAFFSSRISLRQSDTVH